VGYVGKDVDSIITDLVEISRQMIKEKMKREYTEIADKLMEETILSKLNLEPENIENDLKLLREGFFDDRMIEIDIKQKNFSGLQKLSPQVTAISIPVSKNQNLNNFLKIKSEDLEKLLNGKEKKDSKKKKLTSVKNARLEIKNLKIDEFINSNIEKVNKEALKVVEEEGIVFIDEIDKICNDKSVIKTSKVSGVGVQKDLLPLIEGTNVTTKYGNVKTDYILFICAGAFHSVKPSDLLAELQGRLPIRVNLKGLTKSEYYRILTEPETNLIKQNIALIGTEGVQLEFTDDAVNEISKYAHELNSTVENIGARRLFTIMEKVIEDISFNSPYMEPNSKIVVDGEYVKNHIQSIIKKIDMTKFII
jgi:ATP-dependent HslUV protease ATP-binding subunit HslU